MALLLGCPLSTGGDSCRAVRWGDERGEQGAPAEQGGCLPGEGRAGCPRDEGGPRLGQGPEDVAESTTSNTTAVPGGGELVRHGMPSYWGCQRTILGG